ncbi:MAG: hypothetical protein NTZ87_02950 [Candidatus Nomurabacteria bacterium]|nr:hypothetical protein [Candidatus Nomurabacteria bacterium]
MSYKHHEYCNAAICAGDPKPDYKNEHPWYPGEEVCKLKPFQKFQKKQLAINKEVKKGTFRNTDTPFVAFELENKSI